jgi:hypothetical protein
VLDETIEKLQHVDIDRLLTLVILNSQELCCANVVGLAEFLPSFLEPIFSELVNATPLGSGTFDRARVAKVGRVDCSMSVEDFDDFGRAPASGVQTNSDDWARQGVEKVSRSRLIQQKIIDVQEFMMYSHYNFGICQGDQRHLGHSRRKLIGKIVNLAFVQKARWLPLWGCIRFLLRRDRALGMRRAGCSCTRGLRGIMARLSVLSKIHG